LSAHVNETVTLLLFQAAPFAAEDAEPSIVGFVASRLIETSTGPAAPPALCAAQLYVVAAWSDVMD
jgi:hypothetical protein